jgi:hypothetical protein
MHDLGLDSTIGALNTSLNLRQKIRILLLLKFMKIQMPLNQQMEIQ